MQITLDLLAANSAPAREWQFLNMNSRAVVDTPLVRFAPDGALSGTTGCNRFQGTARFEDGSLVIDGPIASTRMACPGAALAAQDDAVVALFDGRISVTFDPLKDILTLANSDTIVELVRFPVSGEVLPELPSTHAGREPPAGEPRYMNPYGSADDLPIHARPDAASDVVGGAFSGQVLRNLGCIEDWCAG